MTQDPLATIAFSLRALFLAALLFLTLSFLVTGALFKLAMALYISSCLSTWLHAMAIGYGTGSEPHQRYLVRL